MEWFLILPLFEKIPIILGAVDLILGSLPDKYCRWPGVILMVCNKLYEYGKLEKEKAENK